LYDSIEDFNPAFTSARFSSSSNIVLEIRPDAISRIVPLIEVWDMLTDDTQYGRIVSNIGCYVEDTSGTHIHRTVD
jgi:hypothetical protein